jgi:hypothetical protein
VACPYFLPQVPLETGPWVHAPRWPLGAAYAGVCQACPGELFEPLAERQETLCNRGYARGICERFPPSAPFDAVRFSVLDTAAESLRFVWILERDHAPAQFGAFEYDASLKRPVAPGLPGTFDRQAEIFALSHLTALNHLATIAG